MTTTFTPTTAGPSHAEATAVVRLDNLHVAWDTDLILHGISLSIPAGQTVALTGSNGSGKSTTLKALLGTAPITSGDARLFGHSVTTHRRVPWNRIGYVPQRISSGGAICASAIEVVRSGLLGPLPDLLRRPLPRRNDCCGSHRTVRDWFRDQGYCGSRPQGAQDSRGTWPQPAP